MGRFACLYVDEPDLIFGHGGEEKDPRLGLKHYGPWFSSTEAAPSPGQVRVGVIGSGETITLAKQVLDLLKGKVTSDKPNRWQYPDFPGFRMDSRIRSELVNADRWNASLIEPEIKDVLNVVNANERIAAASRLFADKLQSIAIEEDQPQVVICALPWG